MAYTTFAKMKTRYDDRTLVKLSDDAGTGLIASACVEALIDRASGFINRYICKRYSTSATATNGCLENICEEITMTLLYDRRGDVPPAIMETHRANIEYLISISEGVNDLPGQSAKEDVFIPKDAASYADSGNTGKLLEFLDEDSDDFTEYP